MNSFSLSPLFRSSVGFDRFNDLFESVLQTNAGTSYPPYNVEKHGDDDYRIVVAAAGVKESDLDIQVEQGVLTISGSRRDNASDDVEYLHQGIAQRGFNLTFRLDDYIEVTGADLKDGMLTVSLVRRVPEEAKPRRISIGSNSESLLRTVAKTVGLEKKTAA